MAEHVVKTGGMAVSSAPDTFRTHGVGSCVVVCLYDAEHKVGGMAHVMLAERRATGSLQVGDTEKTLDKPAMYASDAVAVLLEEIKNQGGDTESTEAFIAGGAHMFKSIVVEGRTVGDENIAAVMHELEQRDIPIRANETGGTGGRLVAFDLATGEFTADVRRRKRSA